MTTSAISRGNLRHQFRLAGEFAKKIGKGWLKIQANGLTPLILHPNYFKELRSSSTIRFLSAQERAKHLLVINEGQLFKGGRPYDTTSGKTISQPMSDIFVVSPDNHLYGGTVEVGKFQHSAFLQGGAVCFGGEMETNTEGRIIRITNRSGHYRPDITHLLYALNILKGRGVNLKSVELEVYTHAKPQKVYTYASAEVYLQCRGKCSPQSQLTI